MPAFAFELLLDAFVPRLVTRELLLPELHVALGFACVLASLMLMPITPMNEQGNPPARIGDIGVSGALLPVAAISGPTHLT